MTSVDRFFNAAGEYIIAACVVIAAGFMGAVVLFIAVMAFLAAPIAWALLPVGVLVLIARLMGWL